MRNGDCGILFYNKKKQCSVYKSDLRVPYVGSDWPRFNDKNQSLFSEVHYLKLTMHGLRIMQYISLRADTS